MQMSLLSYILHLPWYMILLVVEYIERLAYILTM